MNDYYLFYLVVPPFLSPYIIEGHKHTAVNVFGNLINSFTISFNSIFVSNIHKLNIFIIHGLSLGDNSRSIANDVLVWKVFGKNVGHSVMQGHLKQ